MKVPLFSKQKPIHLFYFSLLFVSGHFFSIVMPVAARDVDNVWIWVFNFVCALTICALGPFSVYRILLPRLKYDNIKSGLCATALFLPFFFFQDLLLSSEHIMFAGVRSRLILPFFGILLVVVCYLILRSKKSFYSLNQYLNITSFSLVIYTILTICLSFDRLGPKVLRYNPAVYELSCKDCPDIYLFLLDSYTSNQSLKDYFHFDNRDFTEKLEALNFKVNDQTYSSYSRTTYSQTSTLNLNWKEGLDVYNKGLNEVIRKNSVVETLKKAGYSIHNFSIFDFDGSPRYYEMTRSFGISLLNSIAQSSILNIVIFDAAMKLELYAKHIDILRQIHNEGEKVSATPRFFYAHLLAPHPPFVMDAQAEPIPFFLQPKNMANKEGYVAQVRGVNKLILEAVGDLVKRSPNAIVVIMGDHGYRYLDEPGKEKEAFTVFMAYRGPNKDSLDSLNKSHDIFKVVLKGLNPSNFEIK